MKAKNGNFSFKRTSKKRASAGIPRFLQDTFRKREEMNSYAKNSHETRKLLFNGHDYHCFIVAWLLADKQVVAIHRKTKKYLT